MELAPGRNEARLVIVDGREAVEITLTQNKMALIDPEDWELVRGYRWYAREEQKGYTHAVAHPPGAKRNATKIRMHRLITGAPPHLMVDHRHENATLDNRRSNLRVADNPQNQANSGSRGGTSRYKNVSWNTRKRKWAAAFMHRGKVHFVGCFADAEEAARAVDAESKLVRGPFARLNFPDAA